MAIAVDAGVIVTALGLGVRHGIDWDHIAAISDLTAGAAAPRRQMRLAGLYASGHAVVVLALGTVAILIGGELPTGVDHVMGRVVGVTLVALGLYVTIGVLRRGHDFRMRSRWMLLGDAAKRLWQRAAGREVVIVHDHPHGSDHGHEHGPAHGHDLDELLAAAGDREPAATLTTTAHRHPHTHRGYLPADPQIGTGSAAAFGIGMLHGIGAETPTQLVLFVAAAGAGGGFAGELLLVAFTVGLVASNTAVAFAATAGLLQAERHRRLYLAVASTVGLFSLVVGTVFLLDLHVLPPIFTG